MLKFLLHLRFFEMSLILTLIKGAGSRVRPQDNVVVLKLVDGVNPTQQLKRYLVGKCITVHHENLNVYNTTDNNLHPQIH